MVMKGVRNHEDLGPKNKEEEEFKACDSSCPYGYARK
jgi:hypothetical protein